MLVGCGTPPTPSPAPPPKPLPALEVGTSTWREVGLELATFTGVELAKHPWPAGGVASQTVVVDGSERLDWLLRLAPDESMRGFDDDHHDWVRTEGPPVVVCGHAVPVAIATHAAEDIECVIMADGTPNHPEHIAPRLAYAIAVPHHGMTLVARFEIESENVERWRPMALRFLASLRCH